MEVPTDYATLSEAIAAASDGETITILAGTHAADVDLAGVSVTLRGAGSGATILECVDMCITATRGETLAIEGLTLRNGARGVDATGELTLTDVILTGLGDGSQDGAAVRLVGGNLAWIGGSADYTEAANGALYLESAAATLDGVDLQYGAAASGGAIYAWDSAVDVSGGALVRNEATGDGGAVWASGGSVTIDGAVVVANTAGGDGGGVWADGTEVAIAAATVEQNAAGGYGGALHLVAGEHVVASSAFEDNAALAVADLWSTEADLSLTDTSFEGGSASGLGYSTGTGYDETALVWIDAEANAVSLDGLAVADDFGGRFTCAVCVDASALVVRDLRTTSPSTDAPGLVLWGERLEASGELETDSSASLGATEVAIDGLAWSTSRTMSLYAGAGTLRAISFSGASYVYVRSYVPLEDATFDDTALYCEWSGAVLDGATFDASSAIVRSDTTWTDVRFVDSPSTAILVEQGATLDVDGLSVQHADVGLQLDDGAVRLRSAHFAFDTTGIAVASGTLDAVGAVFFRNTDGVAVAGGDVTLENVVFQDNRGSGLAATGGFPLVYNATAVGNDGDAFALDDGYVALVNVIAAYGGGAGLWAAEASTAAASTVRYDDLWSNAGGAAGGAFVDPTGTDGNIAADPLFVAWTDDDSQEGDDLHLTAGSPCLDAGYPGWSDADGTVSDIGAFGGAYGDLVDYDGDLVLESEGDCDDSDAGAYPGAEEIPDDGADNDCAGDGDAVTPADTGSQGDDTGTPADDTGSPADDTSVAEDTGSPSPDSAPPDTAPDSGDDRVDGVGEEHAKDRGSRCGGCGSAGGASGLWVLAALLARYRPRDCNGSGRQTA
ncbi:MAG: MopE-related protein [Myxococcota bacterium]